MSRTQSCAGPRRDGEDGRLCKKGVAPKQREVPQTVQQFRFARKEDTEETARLEHVDL